jgi:hypothetical protein
MYYRTIDKIFGLHFIFAIFFLQDFGRMVKFYNRIATALVKFESLWLSMWKSRIESAKVALKLPLLAHHFESKELIVNADERYIESAEVMNGFCLRFSQCQPIIFFQGCGTDPRV